MSDIVVADEKPLARTGPITSRFDLALAYLSAFPGIHEISRSQFLATFTKILRKIELVKL